MPDTEKDAIVVKRQNFDKSMESIRVFAEQSKEHEPLDRVSYSGGFLGLGDHKVTGYELNNVVSQVEDQLVDLKNFDLGVLDIITNIYKALDALDKEHISGILIAANAAKVASDKATKNVETIQKIIKVLQEFKDKLDKLEHLMDVDKAWKLLEEQKRLLKTLGDYKDELSKLKHLKDVDNLWENNNSQSKSIEGLEKKIIEITKVLEAQGKSISNLGSTVKDIGEKQQAFIEAANKSLTERQAAIDKHLEDREKSLQESLSSFDAQVKRGQENLSKKAEDISKAQADALAALGKTQAEKLQQLETAQTERLAAVQKEQSESLMRIGNAQAETLKAIEKDQTERLDRIAADQAEALDKLAHEQVEKLEAINKSLEEEKATLNETVSSLTQKVKVAYIIAGGTATITVIHLLLNILGVL